MVKKYKSFAAGVTLVLGLSACIDQFKEINTDKNDPTAVSPGALLGNVIFEAGRTLADRNMDIMTDVVQYSSGKIGGQRSFENFNWSPDTGEELWDMIYLNMTNVRDMNQKAHALEQKAYEGASLVMEVYLMSLATDAFGDVPYRQAWRLDENLLRPAYDPQAVIYDSLLVKLNRADQLFMADETGMISGGDFIFDGDVEAWQGFGNALQLRLLARMITKDPSKISQFAEVAQRPLLTTNAMYTFSGVAPDLSPVFLWRETDFNLRRLSVTMAEMMNGLNDPRRSAYYERPQGETEWVGCPIGYTIAQFDADPQNHRYATLNQSFLDNGAYANATFMSYAEQEFLLAEAVLKNWINGEAEIHYNRAVTSSIAFWNNYGGSGLTPEAYLAQAEVAFSGELEQVLTQKYIAQFANPFECWFDYQRTGFPALKLAHTAQVNNGDHPAKRFMYPSFEAMSNHENMRNAIDRTMNGVDDINATIWWNN